jgi:hypothetical protein
LSVLLSEIFIELQVLGVRSDGEDDERNMYKKGGTTGAVAAR